MGWLVYLLRCSDSSLYCGITNDLAKRLQTHRSGRGSKYVRSRLPVQVVWTEEQPDMSTALKREFAIKDMRREAKERLIAKPKCAVSRSAP